MMMISVLRYRAAIHPLKPAISRGKLKAIVSLAYIVGCIAGFGAAVPACFLSEKDIKKFDIVHSSYIIACYYFFPTLFMAVIYYKIRRQLTEQDRYMKNVRSNHARERTANASFNILTFLRNRRTTIISCCTVLCYGVGNIPMSVLLTWHITSGYDSLSRFVWFVFFANIFRVSGSHVVNPLIYGILDKRISHFGTFALSGKESKGEIRQLS